MVSELYSLSTPLSFHQISQRKTSRSRPNAIQCPQEFILKAIARGNALFGIGFAKYFKNVSHERKVVFFIRLHTLEVLQPNAVIFLQLLFLEFKLETAMKRAVQLKNEVTEKKKKKKSDAYVIESNKENTVHWLHISMLTETNHYSYLIM